MPKFQLLRAAAKEPALHIVALGAALMVAYTWVDQAPAGPAEPADQVVHITGSQVAWLQQSFFREWRRAPTQAELRVLVAEHLREQLLAREARALHLDADDSIVRRRLAEKMTLVLAEKMRLDEPDEDELRRYFEANVEQFATPSRVSFTHVYLRADRRKDPASDAQTLLAALSRGEVDPAYAGDRTLFAGESIDADEQTIADALGPDFARALFSLPRDSWQGPLESRHGLHLVRVTKAVPGQARTFAEARSQVRERWRKQRQREGMDRYLVDLMAKYDVVVDAGVQSSLGPLTPPLVPAARLDTASARR